jgi:hypothetical protein
LNWGTADTRGRARPQARRDRIEAGALRLFLERGFAATSTEAVACEAKVSKPTLYSYYPGKEELFAAVIGNLVEKVPHPLPMYVDDSSLRSRESVRDALLGLAWARVREQGAVEVKDAEAAGRMFVGSLLTYALLDGLLVGEGPVREPSPGRIEEVVDLYVKAIA